MTANRVSAVGAEYVVEVGPVAHGGHCVARHEGLVLFVRHSLPGERVRARVIAGRTGDRFLLAEAIEVLEPSEKRVDAPCRYAGPSGCGGCDFQHVDLAYQREMKAAVVREQLSRLAGVDRTVTVEPLAGHEDGLGWRTRVNLAVDRRGRTGFHPHRSREVLAVDECLLAAPGIADSEVFSSVYPRAKAVHAVVSSTGERAVVTAPQGLKRTPSLHERVVVGGEEALFRLNALGFWQVHPAAAQTFVDRVLEGLAPEPGERCLDLYSGVGLFARALARSVGGTGEVVAVESDSRAAHAAADHFAGDGQVSILHGRVDHALPELVEQGASFDLVVLDPPRTGAGRDVVEAVAALRPRAVAYVACDPAALSRDIAYAAEAGYVLRDLSVFDAFPMTHHMECIAILCPEATTG
ncbi:23S rRNA m(5)U-1939 methyltransferase [Austwickia chelonae]|uniref:Putative RNA methyltransferase n=1 Tax=Austwickia chelonae NBRC 105200 TaxID=1184607 RepID=K6ULV9_9MICO|nr:RsmD family RNA methyltransferase [Austwickia chelonae]GAB77586.1 putative RNA methyltransferase [Austwickia chelonae NBRC 105200]SEW13506.1 23S rRNA m(5)U-1939 methyltransferase [Austwickia chelonae]